MVEVNWKVFVVSLLIVIIAIGTLLLNLRLNSLYKDYGITKKGVRLDFENASITQDKYDEISSKDSTLIIAKVLTYGGIVAFIVFLGILASVEE